MDKIFSSMDGILTCIFLYESSMDHIFKWEFCYWRIWGVSFFSPKNIINKYPKIKFSSVKSSIDGKSYPWIKVSSMEKMMDNFLICWCHPWMNSTNKDDGWRTWTQPLLTAVKNVVFSLQSQFLMPNINLIILKMIFV